MRLPAMERFLDWPVMVGSKQRWRQIARRIPDIHLYHRVPYLLKLKRNHDWRLLADSAY